MIVQGEKGLVLFNFYMMTQGTTAFLLFLFLLLMLGIQGLSGSGEYTRFICSLSLLYLFDFLPIIGLKVFLLAF